MRIGRSKAPPCAFPRAAHRRSTRSTTMSPFKKLAAAASLALCALAPTAALATNFLYLSTAEGYTSKLDDDPKCPETENRTDGRNFIKNAADAFTAKKTSGKITNFINLAGVLSSKHQIERSDSYFYGKNDSTLGSTEASIAAAWKNAENILNNAPGASYTLVDGDIVVVQSAYKTIDPGKADFIVEKIKERTDLTFILLLDTCTQCSYDTKTCATAAGGSKANLTAILQPAINDYNGWNLLHEHLENSRQVTNKKDAYGVSAYVKDALDNDIISLSQLQGHTTGAIQCVPKHNIIFPSATPMNKAAAEALTPPDASRDTGYKFAYNKDTGWYCNDRPYKSNGWEPQNINSDCVLTEKGGDPDKPNADGHHMKPADWSELNASSSYGMIIPFWQNNRGKGGACIYLGQDNNIFDNTRKANHSDVVDMFLSLPTPTTGACRVGKEVAQASGVCKTVDFNDGKECTLIGAPEDTNPEDLAVLHTRNADGSTLCPPKVWGVCTDETRANAYCINEENSKDHCCTDCTPAIRKANGLCKPGQQTDINCCETCPTDEADRPVCGAAAGETPGNTCCKCEDGTEFKGGKCMPVCPTDLNLLPVCTSTQDPAVDCCKPRDPDPVCTEEELAEYCCDAARSECCKPCDENKKKDICKEDQNPDLFCCTCPPRYEDRPICKEGQVPADDITKSGNKAANVVCCRLEPTPPTPSTASPVPTTGWPALLGLGALLPLLARRQRRQSKRRDDA